MGRTRKREATGALWGSAASSPFPCLQSLAPAWLATGLLRIGSKQCRPGKSNVHPKEENNEDKESDLPQCAGGRVISF